MKILVRADASPRMGGGHVMRCLALADRLEHAEVRFVSAMLPPGLEQKIVQAGHRLLRIPKSDRDDERRDWDEFQASDASQREDAAATLAALQGWRPDRIIVDHYRLARPWERMLREAGAPILAIDDLANRPHECDLLVDHGPGRPPSDYAGLVPATAKVLAGSLYALLRPEFGERRRQSLQRRRRAGPVESLLISLGSTDNDGNAPRALAAALDAATGARIRLVLPRDAASYAAAAALAAGRTDVEILADVDMAKLIAEADLAIGAGGGSASERCCLGLPSVALAINANQRGVLAGLEAAGAAAVAEELDGIAPALRQLAESPRARLAMTAAAAALVDGEGAARVAAALTGDAGHTERELRFRPAAARDSEHIWLWRNDPATRGASEVSDPVPWPEHEAWFARMLGSPDCVLLLVEEGGLSAGIVRFDRRSERSFEVSINLRPDVRGGGMGRRVLEGACRAFFEKRQPARLEARIHRSNAASQRIFASLGFLPASELGDTGFRRYVRPEGSLPCR